MNEADIEAFAPQYRAAVREIIDPPRYIRQSDIKLLETEDIVEWIPDAYVLKLVPNARDIRVVLVDEYTNPDELLAEFKRQGNIGLVLMGDDIGPRKRPSIIVMTTSSCLYAIDPDFEHGIEFLKICLQEEGLKFWTTNGLQEACCLLNQFDISLKGSKAKDCLGMHLHMMKILSLARDRSPDTAFYPIRAIEHAKRQRQRLESFERLVYIWLNIDRNRELECDPSKYRHLSQRPLNLTAKNLIRKRCSLVLCLAEKLDCFATGELARVNNNVMYALTNIVSDSARKKLKNHMAHYEKLRIPPMVYFQHLDAIDRIARNRLYAINY